MVNFQLTWSILRLICDCLESKCVLGSRSNHILVHVVIARCRGWVMTFGLRTTLQGHCWRSVLSLGAQTADIILSRSWTNAVTLSLIATCSKAIRRSSLATRIRNTNSWNGKEKIESFF